MKFFHDTYNCRQLKILLEIKIVPKNKLECPKNSFTAIKFEIVPEIITRHYLLFPLPI